MVFWTTVLIVFVTVTATEATVDTVCHGDTDCGASECCYAKPDFMVVSKRGPPLFLPEPGLATPKPGICERFRTLHEPCGPLEKMNGHCSCGAGMSCQFVPAPTDGLVASKRKIFMPGPGTYQCELIQ